MGSCYGFRPFAFQFVIHLIKCQMLADSLLWDIVVLAGTMDSKT